MVALSSIRQGIGTNLGSISTLSVYNFMPDFLEPPCAVVGVMDQIEYDSTMNRGTDKYQIPVLVIVSRVDAQDSQDTLDGFLANTGSSSVKQAIESDVTLGGVVSTVRVTEARDYGVYNMNNTDYLACNFIVEIIGWNIKQK